MSIPRMNYPQYRKARKLVRECCNYCDGNCLLLDDGEECVCVQSISYSLLCRWFRAAVLPLDAALCAEITKDRDVVKRCSECGAAFMPKSNRAKYCPACAKRMRRRKEAERQHKFSFAPVFQYIQFKGIYYSVRFFERQIEGFHCGRIIFIFYLFNSFKPGLFRRL